MAIGEHSLIKLTAEDKVITMCPPVPGTEKHTTNSINTLYEYDVNLSIFDKDVLRSAHASPEDLKTLYAMLKPKYIVPIKGEYRHMYEQNLVAQEYGYDKDHIMLLDNGQVLEFNDGELASTDKCIEVGDIYIDGTSVGVVDETVIQERTQLAEEGIIFVYCSVDLKKKCLSSPINISTKGISYGFSAEELTNSLSGIIESMILNAIRRNDWNLKEFETKLAIEVAKQILRFTKHRPLVIPVILEN
jgi:ribonuclease J